MKINQIYIFRFVAAILVVFYHFFTKNFQEQRFLYNVFANGDEGVSFFFSLSGFIMVISYEQRLNDQKDRINYWMARIARVFPLYFFALVIFVLYYFFIDRHVASSVPARLVPEVLMLQSWLGKTSLNFPGWSLSAEMFFYVLFPYFFARIRHWGFQKLIAFTIAFFLLVQCTIFMLSYVPALLNNEAFVAALYYSPYCHVITFFMGVSTGLLYTKNYNAVVANQARINILLLLAAVVYLYIIYLSNRPMELGILTPVYCIFIFIISTPVFARKMLTNRVAVFLGDISYGIYILQYPVFLFCAFFFRNNMGINAFMLCYFFLLILTSSLAFFTIEKPGSALIKHLHNRYIKNRIFNER